MVEPLFYQNQLDFVRAVAYEVVLDNRDLALEVFYALEENELTFEEVAREYIPNLQLRRAGGYQGVRRRKDFRPEIAATVYAGTQSQVMKPIVTSKGVYFI